MSTPTTPPAGATDVGETSQFAAVPPAASPAAPAKPAPMTISIRLRPLETLRAVPRVGMWIGLGLCAVAAVALLVTWRKTAGLMDVGLQMPFLISGGLISLGLAIVGLLLISLDAHATEAARRREQLTELKYMISQLNRTDLP